METYPAGFFRVPHTRTGWWAVGLFGLFLILFLINSTIFVPAAEPLPLPLRIARKHRQTVTDKTAFWVARPYVSGALFSGFTVTDVSSLLTPYVSYYGEPGRGVLVQDGHRAAADIARPTIDIAARPYADELQFAHELVDIAARITRRHVEHPVEVRHKEDATPVTDADVAVEAALREGAALRFPGDGFVGEEGGRTEENGRVWVVDPIDGTKNFVGHRSAEHGQVVPCRNNYQRHPGS